MLVYLYKDKEFKVNYLNCHSTNWVHIGYMEILKYLREMDSNHRSNVQSVVSYH